MTATLTSEQILHAATSPESSSGQAHATQQASPAGETGVTEQLARTVFLAFVAATVAVTGWLAWANGLCCSS